MHTVRTSFYIIASLSTMQSSLQQTSSMHIFSQRWGIMLVWFWSEKKLHSRITCVVLCTYRPSLKLYEGDHIIPFHYSKGSSGQIRPASKWYHWIGLDKDIPHCRCFYIFIIILVWNFEKEFKVSKALSA